MAFLWKYSFLLNYINEVIFPSCIVDPYGDVCLAQQEREMIKTVHSIEMIILKNIYFFFIFSPSFAFRGWGQLCRYGLHSEYSQKSS